MSIIKLRKYSAPTLIIQQLASTQVQEMIQVHFSTNTYDQQHIRIFINQVEKY